MTPDPFADDQDALNRPSPPSGLTSNAHCPDCDVKWKANSNDATWPCWICDTDRKPLVLTPSIAANGAFMAGCVGLVMQEAEARELEEAWERAFMGYEAMEEEA